MAVAKNEIERFVWWSIQYKSSFYHVFLGQRHYNNINNKIIINLFAIDICVFMILRFFSFPFYIHFLLADCRYRHLIISLQISFSAFTGRQFVIVFFFSLKINDIEYWIIYLFGVRSQIECITHFFLLKITTTTSSPPIFFSIPWNFWFHRPCGAHRCRCSFQFYDHSFPQICIIYFGIIYFLFRVFVVSLLFVFWSLSFIIHWLRCAWNFIWTPPFMHM